MEVRQSTSGPDPSRVLTLEDLTRELALLRARAARGTRSAKISLDELAARIGEPKSTIHAYLSGKRLAPAELLDRIVIALGATRGEQREWAEAWFRVGAHHERARRAPSASEAAHHPAGVAVPHQLPLAADGFVGRGAELAELDAAFAGRARIAAVSGTPGVGKTALALHWAHQRLADFPDGQLYLDLRGYDPVRPIPTSEAAARLLRALGTAPAAIPRDLDERAALLRSTMSGRRLLVVLDNARDTEHVRALLPGTPTCAVIVTSRDSLSGLIAREGAHRLDLDVLPAVDATALLRSLAGERGSSAELADLAGLCARLPLALRVAAELVAARLGPSVGEIVTQLATGEHELDLLEAGDDPRTALRAVFSWSYRRLTAEQAGGFRLAGLHPGTDMSVEAFAALIGAELASARQVLAVLNRAHLVQEIRPGSFGMHNLLRAYARELAATLDGEHACSTALGRLRGHYVHSTAVSLLAAVDEQPGLRVAGQPGTRGVAV